MHPKQAGRSFERFHEVSPAVNVDSGIWTPGNDRPHPLFQQGGTIGGQQLVEEGASSNLESSGSLVAERGQRQRTCKRADRQRQRGGEVGGWCWWGGWWCWLVVVEDSGWGWLVVVGMVGGGGGGGGGGGEGREPEDRERAERAGRDGAERGRTERSVG